MDWIDESSKIEYTDELSAMLTVFDNDFYSKTNIFIGNIWSVPSELYYEFKIEQQLFASNSTDLIVSTSNSLLRFLVHSNADLAYYLKNLGSTVNTDKDIGKIIDKLFNNQGNVKKTADQLFMHRNTLSYKLKKFYEQTGFELKNMDDLLCCYVIDQLQD